MTLVLAVLLVLAFVAAGVWAATGKLSTHEPDRVPMNNQRDTLSPWAIVAALLLPIVGVIIAIVLLAQGRGAHGAAVLLTSVLGWVLVAALIL